MQILLSRWPPKMSFFDISLLWSSNCLFRQTYLCKTTSNKEKKKVVLTVNMLGNNESIGRIFIHFFYLLFLTQMHILLALFITSIEFIPLKKTKPDITDRHCELSVFVLLMSDHQFLFGFVFSLFFFFGKYGN